jgi:hypothetical protein
LRALAAVLLLPTALSVQVVSGAGAAKAISPAAVSQGLAFDTCAYISHATLDAWDNYSPYWAIGIYIAGNTANKPGGCGLTNMRTADLNYAESDRVGIIPIVDDLQPPCMGYTFPISYDGNTAFSQGVTTGNNSVASASSKYGLGYHSVLYLDIENWNHVAGSACDYSVDQYVSGWDYALSTHGIYSGVYFNGVGSDANSKWSSLSHPPNDVWGVDWTDVAPNPVTHIAGLSDNLWPAVGVNGSTGHRMHQYYSDDVKGNNDTWGGVTLHVDRDCMSGPVNGYTNNGTCIGGPTTP